MLMGSICKLTLELTALDLRELSASRSQSIGAVNPPSRNAGSVLVVSRSLPLIACSKTLPDQRVGCKY